MKAVLLDKPGQPSTLYTGEITRPEPGPGEVRVRVHALSLNPVDYKLAAAGHPAWTYPFVLGLDVAGTIDALGSGCGKLCPWRSRFLSRQSLAAGRFRRIHGDRGPCAGADSR